MNTKTQSFPVCNKGHNREVFFATEYSSLLDIFRQSASIVAVVAHCCCDLTDPVLSSQHSWRPIINSSLVANSSRHRTFAASGKKQNISRILCNRSKMSFLKPFDSNRARQSGLTSCEIWNNLSARLSVSFSITVPVRWHSGWHQGTSWCYVSAKLLFVTKTCVISE